MFLKKSILTLSIVTLSSISLIANAALSMQNFTDEDSSVKVTSGILKPCSSQAGVYTPKRNTDGSPGESSAKDNEILFLCKTTPKGQACTADIYNTANCTGTRVGYASLNLTTKTVTAVASLDESKYIFHSYNGGTLLTVEYPPKK